MCLGGEGSSPIKGAGGTALAGFGLDLVGGIFKHNEQNKAIAARNRERLNIHERNRWKYHRDYQDRVWMWGNENINREIEVDNAFQKSIEGLADSQLKVWQSLKEGTLAEQEAFAAMMSVGGGEQTGARSGVTTTRREQVIAYGHKMNTVAAARSGGRDAAMLYAEKVRNRFADFAKQKDVESGTSRPVYGAPPVAPILEEKASIWSTLLDVGKSGLAWKMKYDQLKAPEDNSVVIPEQPPVSQPAQTPAAFTPVDSNPWSIDSYMRNPLVNDGIFVDAPLSGALSDKQIAKSNQVTFDIG